MTNSTQTENSDINTSITFPEVPPNPDLYLYRAEVAHIVDGDTVDLRVDMGFNVTLKERFRLYGINAPESRTRDHAEKMKGLEATNFLSYTLNDPEADIYVQSIKDKKGKYGRYLGIIYMTYGTTGIYVNVNKMMVEEGHAIYKEY